MGQSSEYDTENYLMEADEDSLSEIDLMDDETPFDEVNDFDDTSELSEIENDHRSPLWRLIEMSREERLLKLELQDFEDYDILDGFNEFENTRNHYSRMLSH